MDEREGDELGEPAGLVLDPPQEAEVPGLTKDQVGIEIKDGLLEREISKFVNILVRIYRFRYISSLIL